MKIVRRLTTVFLEAVPDCVEHFDAKIYAVVSRKKAAIVDGQYGTNVRLDPCILDWDKKTITIHIPENINHGITNIDDLDESFFEQIQAAFLLLINACIETS